MLGCQITAVLHSTLPVVLATMKGILSRSTMVQEQQYQRQQLMARYQSATAMERERIQQQLMAQRQQQMMQQQGLMGGLSAPMPGSHGMGGFDTQVIYRSAPKVD